MAVGDGIVYAGLTLDGAGYDPDEDDVPEHYDGVYAFDADTGEIEWSIGTDGIPHIALANGTVYASSGTLVAIRSEDGRADSSPDEDGDQDETGDDEAAEDDANETDDDASDDADGTDDTNESTVGGTESETDAGDTGDNENNVGSATEDADEEPVPGFTTGAGVLGGAAALEWLRRQADNDGPTDDATE